MENWEDYREIVAQLLRRRIPKGYMLTGSVAELPLQYVASNLTDFDHMDFPLILCALSPTDPFPKRFLGDVLLVETSTAYPGFARLRYYNNPSTYFERSSLLQSLTPGPAIKGTYMSFTEFSSLLSEDEKRTFQQELGKYEITTFDIVYCVVCPNWPTVAEEWIKRQRYNGWPTKELLRKVVMGGCHFVAKAHQSCPNDETLFRFSFSSAEIVLVNSWSAVQKYIYHVLRLIKNSVEIQCKAEQMEPAISSYSLKTLMLWACERKTPSFWNESSITSSVTELICELIEWLIDRMCQNYFIPSNNMFEQTTGDVNLTCQVLCSFVCNQSEILKVTEKVSIADQEAYLPFELSDKPTLLIKLAVNRLSHCVNPLNPNSDYSVRPNELIEDCSEFYHLATGLIANLNAAKNSRAFTHNNLDGKFVRTARLHLHESMRANLQTGLNRPTVFHLGRSFLENLPRVIGRSKEDAIAEELQKLNKNQLPSSVDMSNAAHWFVQLVVKTIPNASYFVSFAYASNFYFTYLKEYQECLRICLEAKERHCSLREKIGVDGFYDELCSVILTSKWTPIFDECIQTAFGFILIFHEHFLNRQHTKNGNPVLGANDLCSFVIYISPVAFIGYVEDQCRRRLNRVPTAQDMKDQYLECSRLLLEALRNDQVVRLTTESYKHLMTSCIAVAEEILKKNM